MLAFKTRFASVTCQLASLAAVPAQPPHVRLGADALFPIRREDSSHFPVEVNVLGCRVGRIARAGRDARKQVQQCRDQPARFVRVFLSHGPRYFSRSGAVTLQDSRWIVGECSVAAQAKPSAEATTYRSRTESSGVDTDSEGNLVVAWWSSSTTTPRRTGGESLIPTRTVDGEPFQAVRPTPRRGRPDCESGHWL
jgi:hypothetical protein